MGSKQRLTNFIFEHLDELKYETVLDAFSGSGVVAYEFKRRKKSVTTNDFLHFSYIKSKALIENNDTIIDEATFEKLFKLRDDAPRFIREQYANLFFTEKECYFLDSLWRNISELDNEYKRCLALAAACRACQKKRPRGIFTVIGRKGWDGRRDLKLSIEEQFGNAVQVFNNAVFSNEKKNRAFWKDIMDLKETDFDLVYFDPPYWSPLSDNDYVRRYHFIEGYSLYWKNLKIDLRTKSRKFKSYKSPFSKKDSTIEAFKQLFDRFSDSIIALSYSSNSYPTKEEMISLLREVKPTVEVYEATHRYSFGNQNKRVKNRVKEYLFIGK